MKYLPKASLMRGVYHLRHFLAAFLVFQQILSPISVLIPSVQASVEGSNPLPQLILPFTGSHPVTQDFGQEIDQEELASSSAELKTHNGIDFDMPEGTPILSVDQGKVEISGDSDYGITVAVNHNWGRSVYGHLKETKVAIGQEVTAGQTIGLSGSTGKSTAPHLHFGIKSLKSINSGELFGFIDPKPYLPELGVPAVLADKSETIDPNSAPIESAPSAQMKPIEYSGAVILEEDSIQINSPVTLLLEKNIGSVEATITDRQGEEVATTARVLKKGGKQVLEITPSEEIGSGEYTVRVEKNGEKILEQDFSWGVLALNTSKSIYKPGETARIDLAVLDEKGLMVCDALLRLKIQASGVKSAILSTKTGEIKVNPECQVHDYTTKPDYETTYQVGGEGVYELELTAETKNGSYTITDSFEVHNDVAFDITRETATRIFPSKEYPVNFTIKFNQDFSGEIKEYVPTDFGILSLEGVQGWSQLTQEKGKKVITWSVNAKKGDEVKIGYRFDATDKSPNLLPIGPLRFYEPKLVFEETRQWQLAIDATATWTNGGGDGLWGTCSNWSGGTGTGGCPGSSDIATFNGTSTANSTIDASFAGSVAGVSITSAYTGIITQSRSLTVGSSNFVQNGGTWDGGAQTFDINDGSFTVSGGTHTATTGTWTIERSFTSSGGSLTMTGATVTFDGSDGTDDSTLTCTGSLGGSVVINKGTAGFVNGPDFTNSSGCTITVTSINSQGIATFTNNGTINHTGSTFNLDGNAVGTENADLVNSSGATMTYSGTTITLEGGFTQSGTFDLSGKTITFDGGDSADDSDVICSGSLGGSVTIAKTGSINGGDVTIGAGCTVTVTSINASGIQLLTVNGTMNHTGTTWDMGGNSTGTPQGSLTVGSTGTVTYSGTAISLEGNFTFTSGGTFDLTGKTVTLDGSDGADDSTVSCTGTLGGSWVIAKTASINGGNATIGAGCTVTVTSVDSDMDTLTVNGTMNHTGSLFNLDGLSSGAAEANLVVGGTGTITYSGTAISLEGGYTLTSGGTFDLTGKTVTLDGSDDSDDSTVSCTGTLGGSWVIAKTASINGGDVTIGTGCTVTVTSVDSDMNTMTVNGTINHTGSVFNIDALSSGSIKGNLTIGSAGTVTYSGTAITLEGNFTQNGTWDLAGKTITFDGTDSQDDSTVTCGTSSGFNLAINKTDAGGTTVLGGSCTVADLTRTNGVLSNPASAYTATVQGNFSMSTTDTFGGTNLTLTMSGSGTQTITQNAGTMSGVFKIDKSGGSASLSTALTTGTTCNVVEGTFSLSGKTFTCGSTFTVEDGGNLQLQGSESITTPTLSTGSTVTYKGDGDSIADSYNIFDWGYKNLTIAATDANDSFGASNTLESGLEAYWTMDDSSGSNVSDSSTNGRDATATGTTVVAGTISNARSLSSAASDHITVPSSLPSFSTGGFSVAIWVNPTTTTNWARFIDFGQGQSDDNILLARNASTSTLQFEVYNGATSGGAVQVTSGITNGSWQHLVATVDTSGNVVMYKNGSQTQTGTTAAPQNVTRTSNFIGRSNWAADSYYNGLVDETRIYSRTLNSQEVAAIYAGTTDNSITTLTVGGNFTVSAGVFTASPTMNVAGNFVHSGGTFTHNSGTVNLNGSSQQISGDTTFYNLTKNTSSTDTLTFAASSTQTVVNTMDLQGESGNLLSLRSSSPNTQWEIDPQATRTIEYLDVQDSNNTNATAITTAGFNITNSGNNTNWTFGVNTNSPSSPGSLGPAGMIDGTTSNDTSPTLSFVIVDPDVGDTVQYRVQIDDNADFSSPTVEYLSTLSSQGPMSFTIGQPGTYFWAPTGYIMPDGEYYWRVKAIDQNGVESSYLNASTGVAFRIDANGPVITNVVVKVTSSTAKVTWDTNENSTSVIDYGLTTSYDTNLSSPTLTLTHNLNLGGLTKDTRYHYQLKSVDSLGHIGATGDLVFQTSQSQTGQDATTISNINVTIIGPTSVRVAWGTNHAATGQIDYGKTSDLGDQLIERGRGRNHYVTLTSLEANTSYFYTLSSTGNTTAQVALLRFTTPVDRGVIGPTLLPSPTPTLRTEVPAASGSAGLNNSSPEASVGLLENLNQLILASVQFVSNLLPEGFREGLEGGLTAIRQSLAAPVAETVFRGSVATSTLGVIVPQVAQEFYSGAVLLTFRELPLLFIRYFLVLLELLHLRKKPKPWGVVYDSITKQPIDPAIVYLLKPSQKEGDEETRITDFTGRFGFLVSKGIHLLKVVKTDYLFPSKILQGKSADGDRTNLYFGGELNFTNPDLISVNIPMDQVSFNWNQANKPVQYRKELVIFKAAVFKAATVITLVAALVAYIIKPSVFNLSLILAYFGLIVFHKVFVRSKKWGVVHDSKTGKVMPLVRIQGVRRDGVSDGFCVTDEVGRYYLILDEGEHFLQVEKETPSGIKVLKKIGPIKIKKTSQVINPDIEV